MPEGAAPAKHGLPAFSSEASAAAPIPWAVREKSARRVRRADALCSSNIELFLGNRLVEVQHERGHAGPGGQLGGREAAIRLRLTDSQQLPARLGVLPIDAPQGRQPPYQPLDFVRLRNAGRAAAKHLAQAGI